MKKKLKNAPHLSDQEFNAFEDLIILAGNKAWSAWNKGKGGEWDFLCHILNQRAIKKPVILGEKQLNEIDILKLAEPEQQFIKIAIFGKLSEQQKTAICLNLAKNTNAKTVNFVNNIGEVVENVSGYIQRLRQDESSIQLAESVTPKTKIKLDFNEKEKPSQPQIAEAFLAWIDKPLRQDNTINKTLEYTGLYWQVLSEQSLQRKIMAFYDEQGYNKYTVRHLKAIADLVAIKADEIPLQNQDIIGFENGVLNKKTGQFMPHEMGHYLRAVENFECILNKDTPHFDDWIDFVSDNNLNKKNAILAGLYMVLTNRHEWGLFLEATGIAGAGKSVFSQIASIINGTSNTAYLNLQELEIDRKRAMLIGKSLAISPDQKPYKGSADELKAITGGDSVTVKLVYVDDFAVKLNPVFMLVTNYPLLFTDRNGGIARRRVIIPFDRAIPKQKKDVHFIEKVKTEVYGIVNKLLALFPNPDDARSILENYKELGESKSIKREANHLIDFLEHFELKEKEKASGALRLGSARNNPHAGQEFTLYSAYLFYCSCHNINALNLLSFRNSLSDAFKEAGQKVEYCVTTIRGYQRTNAFWKDKEATLRQWNG